MDGDEDTSDSTFGQTSCHLYRTSAWLELARRFSGDLVLHNILAHDFVVEFERVLFGHVVVDLTLLRLDNKCPVRVNGVSEGVVLEVDVSGPLLLKEVVLVLPAGLLLIHEAAGGARVLLGTTVELAHHLIELVIILYRISGTSR